MTPEKREELKSAALAATPGPYILEQGDGELDSKARWPTDAKVLVFADNDCEHHPVADFSCNHSCRIKFEQEKNALFFSLADPSAILSLIAQVEALTVPQGWKLVPIEPTDDMATMGFAASTSSRIRAKLVYAAMLDAAPTIPAIPGTKEGA